jgi:hypothetical protein
MIVTNDRLSRGAAGSSADSGLRLLESDGAALGVGATPAARGSA